MADELYGSQRVINPIGQLRGAEFARVVVGNVVSLGQSFQAQYSRPARPVMSIGSPEVLFIPGQGQGSVSLGRLLGVDGMFSLLNSGVGDCGQINTLQLSLGGGRCVVAPTQTLNFGGAMLEGVAISLGSSNPEIVENYNIRISTLERLT